MTERWIASGDKERWWLRDGLRDEFPTRDEAVAYGCTAHEGRFWVGRVKPYDARTVGEDVASDLLGSLRQNSYEVCGEASGGWPSRGEKWNADGSKSLDPIPAELVRRCQELVDWYLAQDPPTFSEMECVEEIRGGRVSEPEDERLMAARIKAALAYSLGAHVEALVGEVDANAFLAPEESAAFLGAAKEAAAALDLLDRAATRLGICLQERAKHTCPTCNRDVPLPDEESDE